MSKRRERDWPVGAEASGWKQGKREVVAGSNYSRPCPPIHHKTSRPLFQTILIITARIVMFITALLLRHYHMQNAPHVNTCYQFLRMLICLALYTPPPQFHILLMCSDQTCGLTCTLDFFFISPPASICINHQPAHMISI